MISKIQKCVFAMACFVSLLSSGGCGQIATSLVTPNQCKKCEVINSSGYVGWSEENCGGGVYNMEQRAKAEAYDLGCDYKVKCNTWKKEKEE